MMDSVSVHLAGLPKAPVGEFSVSRRMAASSGLGLHFPSLHGSRLGKLGVLAATVSKIETDQIASLAVG